MREKGGGKTFLQRDSQCKSPEAEVYLLHSKNKESRAEYGAERVRKDEGRELLGDRIM